jgi:two-component system chemotaxis response regulator CheB
MTDHDEPSSQPETQAFEPVASETLIVIAASAGGLDALSRVLSTLPRDFAAAIAIVQHRSEVQSDLLPLLLAERTALCVRHARNGDLLAPGTVYVCPPGMHMLTERSIRLVPGPRLNHVRPSADLMFRSSARAYGDGTIGVILSGKGSDGAFGTLTILEAGGSAIAQDPSTCAYDEMPSAALACGDVARVSLDAISGVLQKLVHRKRASRRVVPATAEANGSEPLTTVLLADDHAIMLDGLDTLLRAEPDLEVIARAEDGHTAVWMTEQLDPDVVVMDIGMPDLNGIVATRRIRARNKHTRILALSSHDDTQSALAMLGAGATGFVCKRGAFSELALAIRLVKAGKRYLSPQIAAALRNRIPQRD